MQRAASNRVISNFSPFGLWLLLFSLLNWPFYSLSEELGAVSGSDIDAPLVKDFDLLMEQATSKSFRLGGFLKNETAYRFDEPRSFTKIRNIGMLTTDWSFGKNFRFYTASRAYYDHVYDLFNYDTIAARQERSENEPLNFIEDLQKEKDSPVAEIREFYFDIFRDDMDVRIGKQFIVWGVIDGLRIVDEINPLDFRELILLDLLDYRIPLWSFRSSYYHNANTLEMVWIPELTFHKPAPPGSEWELFQVLDRTNEPQGFDPGNPGSFNPRLSEYGIRFITSIFDAELSFSYFYTWDDYPTAFRVISNQGVRALAPDEEPAILPTYTRLGILGSTLVKEFKGDILRAEMAYVTGKYFAISNADRDGDGFLDYDGEVKRDHFRWALGYDFNLRGLDVSPSIAQWIIRDYDDQFLVDEYDTTFNLFLRKPLRKISATFSYLLIYFINFDETYSRPRFSFNITDHFQVEAGLDLFVGSRTQFGRGRSENPLVGGVDIEQRAQFVGNFKDNRRVFVNFKYTF